MFIRVKSFAVDSQICMIDRMFSEHMVLLFGVLLIICVVLVPKYSRCSERVPLC